MKIDENMVITFNFTLYDDQGNILDSTEGHEADMAIIGSGELVPGLEDSLIGKEAGDKISVVLDADMAYGEYQEDLEISLNIEDFPDDPEIGEEYLLDAEDMSFPYAVEAIKGDQVQMNGNHLFAGKKVKFELEIIGVRPATEEELDHGHVHPDGHHH